MNKDFLSMIMTFSILTIVIGSTMIAFTHNAQKLEKQCPTIYSNSTEWETSKYYAEGYTLEQTRAECSHNAQSLFYFTVIALPIGALTIGLTTLLFPLSKSDKNEANKQ